jgi:hypothetical protein
MELKLSVNIGATLQVKNARGEWDWIKPEVGCEISMSKGEINVETLPEQFAVMWDNVVGPQFASVVQELINEQVPKQEAVEETTTEESFVEDEKPNVDEDDYY